MKQIYQQIPEEKREKILQAAIAEFAEHGYEKASTNKNIQEASISKGLLFHYFGNKKHLFLATFDYFLDRYVGEMIERIPPLPDLPDDFFERILCLSELKYRYFLQHPEVYFFLPTAYQRIVQKISRRGRKKAF
ncbi:TetR/AcrR family transcriptional regulator [Thermoactinomyces mirandus]|uniref:TetR/AcrR family transcriptional regulator n=1 Tax=Thermoactinomyces mirandus TaxID=2756294 RepID=A0A7W2ASG9_9BACL|nr:TetR/AcrR family transcriptional regulator [Thermoactinomyces mirandus]MBA4602660.1 TetR/AcrR family transcriptional regulator [Thermoactinomyces mirandus]